MMALPEASVPGEGSWSWESQVRQYPKVGPPGVSHEEREVTVAQVDHKPTGTVVARVTTVVDCLLYRNRKGHLVGILNHYRDDCCDFDGMLLERAGNANVWVRPNRRGRGVGSLLVREALDRWPDIDPSAQRYTEGGRALMVKVLSEREAAR